MGKKTEKKKLIIINLSTGSFLFFVYLIPPTTILLNSAKYSCLECDSLFLFSYKCATYPSIFVERSLLPDTSVSFNVLNCRWLLKVIFFPLKV